MVGELVRRGSKLKMGLELRVTVSRSFRIIAVNPVIERQSGSVDAADNSEDSERYVCEFLALGLRAGLEMKEGLESQLGVTTTARSDIPDKHK